MSTPSRQSPSEPFGTFEEIEAAVRETERGRWFLDEYRRRCQPETRELIASLRRIERAIHTGPGSASHTIASLAEKLRGLRSVMPFLAEVSARTAAGTAEAGEAIGGISGLEPDALASPASREALQAQTERLKLLAGEQAALAENLARCSATFASVDAQLGDAAPAPSLSLRQEDKPRIVMLRGNAQPPLPEAEGEEAQPASTPA